MDDKQVLADIRNGKRDGYKAIRERYETRLRDYAANYPLPNKSTEVIVQEVFAQFEKSVHRFNQYSELLDWLYQQTEIVIDKAALEDIRHGGQAGSAVLCQYEDTLCSYLVKEYYVSEEEVHKIVQEMLTNLPKFVRRECKGKLRKQLRGLIKNEVIPKGTVDEKEWVNEIVQRTFFEEPNIKGFNQQHSETRLREILITEYKVPDSVIDKVIKKTFSIQSLNVLDWLKRCAESAADFATVKYICEGNPHQQKEGKTVLYQRHARSLIWNIGYMGQVPKEYRVPPEALKDHTHLDHEIYDVFQNTFMKVFEQLCTFNGEDASFSTWLYKIARWEWPEHGRDEHKQQIKAQEQLNIQQRILNNNTL
jgi:DNA-directed RNA polymerase specialized sigma24 family protein